METPTVHAAIIDARTLARAEGVLVGLRRCTTDQAFHDILDTADRHEMTPLRIARALIAVAANDGNSDFSAIAAARHQWGPLFVTS